ncbi:MAG: hemolysin family protein [Catalinimonas sp.]
MELIPYIVLTLLLSAFFSGLEIAFVSADRLRIELLRRSGTPSGYVLAHFVKHPARFIAALLIGNTVMLTLYGILMARLLEPWLAAHLPPLLNNTLGILLTQTVIATLIVLPVGEFLPKSLFLTHANRLLAVLALPVALAYGLLFVFVIVIVTLARFVIRRLLRLEYLEDQPVFGITDLSNYVKTTLATRQRQEETEVNARIFSNAVDFRTARVRDCMIPRTEIVAIDKQDGLDVLKETFLESGHSRVPVYKETIDDIVGFCHSSALFKKPQTIDEIVAKINIVPEAMLASDLMVQFISGRQSMALVVDEFGGTSGLVTIEDVMEEIFGDIQDEHDDDEWIEQQVDERTYVLSARHEVDYLNEKYHWRIPEGDYETLGGLILSVEEDLPKVGDVIDVPPYTFTVESMDDARIDTLRLHIQPESA